MSYKDKKDILLSLFVTLILMIGTITKSYSQDTICHYFIHDTVHEFNYDSSTIISTQIVAKYPYEIYVGNQQVLCLDLNDDKKRVRKIVILWPDEETTTQVLDSENDYYYTGKGPMTIFVGKPRRFILR